MFESSMKLRSVIIAIAFLFAFVFVLNRILIVPVSADAGVASVIVQLKDDPAAVYKAKTTKAGGQVSADQLQAYRAQLRVTQDQFLNDLRNRGISFAPDGGDVPTSQAESPDTSISATR